MFVLAAAALAVSAALAPESRSAATLRVALGGSDTSSCTSASPCATFGRAYQVAKAGDTIEVVGGTYGNMTINADPSKGSAVVTFRPVAGGVVKLNDLLSYASNVVYTGFEVLPGYGQPDIRGGTNITVEDVRATNFYVTGPVHNVTFRRGDYGPYTSCGGGIHIKPTVIDDSDPAKWPTDVLVDGVNIHDYAIGAACPDAHLDCLHVFRAQRVTIRNSRFVRCKHYGILLNSNGPGQPEGHLVENNFFGDSEISGLAFRGGDGEDFDDVTVRYNSGGSITPQTTNVLRGVRWYANAARDIGPCRSGIEYRRNVVTSGGCHSSDLRADPRFADFGSGDLHLAAGSPAIDHGYVDSRPASDIDGQARSAVADAGADEFGVSGDAPAGGSPPGSGRIDLGETSKRLRLTRRGKVIVNVVCRSGSARVSCSGTISLRAKLSRRSSDSRYAREHGVQIAKLRFSSAESGSTRQRLTVTARGRRVLRRKSRRSTLIVSIRTPVAVKVDTTVRLLPPRR